MRSPAPTSIGSTSTEHDDHVPKADGGANTVLYDGASFAIDEPTQCAVDGQFVYVVDQQEDLGREPVAGGEPIIMDVGGYGGVRTAVAIDSTFVYYGFLGGIFRQAKTSVDAGVALTTTVPYPNNLAVDRGWVYWADQGSQGGPGNDGTVGKVAIDGGARTVLHASLDSPYSIAVNASFTFWVSQGVTSGNGIVPGTGKVFRTGK